MPTPAGQLRAVVVQHIPAANEAGRCSFAAAREAHGIDRTNEALTQSQLESPTHQNNVPHAAARAKREAKREARKAGNLAKQAKKAKKREGFETEEAYLEHCRLKRKGGGGGGA